MVSRIANPEATREERMQSMREMRGGGGPMSSEAERSAAKLTMRVGIPLATSVATGGLGPLAQAAYGAGSTAIGEFGAETIDKITGGKDYSGRQIFGSAVRGSAPFISRLPGANRLINLAKNVGLATGSGVAGGAIEGTVTNAPTALREALVSAGLSTAPQLVAQVPGVIGEEIQKVVGKAETIERGGITPLLTDVLPGLAAFAQRAQSKISSGTLRELEENQLRQIEQEARRLGGVEGVGTPGDVRRVYQDAVTLLGLNKVREITRNADDFSSAANALKKASDDAQSYGSQLMSLEQKAYGEAKQIELQDTEKAYTDYVETLGKQTEKEAAAELGPRIASAETRATESAFPSGVPRSTDTADKGLQIQQLLTQKEEGKPLGLKQVTDKFFEKEYAGIPTQDEVFSLDEISSKIRDLNSKLPSWKIPVLDEIIGRLNKVQKAPSGTSGNIYTGFKQEYRDVPAKFSVEELRTIRRDLENWGKSSGAYGTTAEAAAKDLAKSITALMNNQAPTVFKPEIAQQFLKTQAKYAQVRKLWEDPYVESAFQGIKGKPEQMLERIGSDVIQSGVSSSDYRGITKLLDNLKDIGVEGIPSRSDINSLVQQYIATKALDKSGKIDNTKLLGILNGIERTSTGSIKKLGFGDIAQLENFDVIKQLVDQNTKNGQLDYRGLLTKLSVMGSEDPSKLKALGLGSVDDVDRLNRIVGDMGEQASMAAKARELAKSDTMAGYQVSERILRLLDDSKDIRSVMNVLQDQVVSGATPELRKQAANALVNTRASAIEDLLFGRTQGVSQGAESFNLDKIKKRLSVPSQREEIVDILGQNLMSKIEKDLLPAMALIEQRRNLTGQAGATTRGALIERGASAAVQAPFATGALIGTGLLATGQTAPSAALATIAGTALTIGGTALASKVLARTVGATGLKSKAAAAASIEALINRVNRAPNREAAIDIMNAYADYGTVLDQPSE